jgi:hypothetical protein
MQLYQLLYTSVLSHSASIESVSSIIRNGRMNNPKLNISGLLIFDGVNFCQYLEGPEQNVRWLVERIQSDPRHTRFEIHHEARLDSARLYPNWNVAYSHAVDADLAKLFQRIRGTDALATLHTLVPELAMEA